MTQPSQSESEATSLSQERLRLWLKLLKSSRMIEDEVRRRLRQNHGWTLPRFDVMSALYRSPDGLRMSEISTLLKVANGNVTGIVDKLAEQGLAQRVADPDDRRAHLVHLTAKGRDLFEVHSKDHQDWIDQILNGLDGDDIAGMMARLERLETTLSDEVNDAD